MLASPLRLALAWPSLSSRPLAAAAHSSSFLAASWLWHSTRSMATAALKEVVDESPAQQPVLDHAVVSTFDMYSIGVGPSSSHTVGPMRAANMFARRLQEKGLLEQTSSVQVDLYGSLACTGEGHYTPQALLMGLEGDLPESVVPETIQSRFSTIKETGKLNLLGTRLITYVHSKDMRLLKDKVLPFHPNGVRMYAFNDKKDLVDTNEYFSVGGGFVIDAEAQIVDGKVAPKADSTPVPFPFSTSADLVKYCNEHSMSISDIVLANELAWRSEEEVRAGLLKIWKAMDDSIMKGVTASGILPGGLGVKRRSRGMYEKLVRNRGITQNTRMPVLTMGSPSDWVATYAIAVNEENAAGGRIVTAPTNGAAGILPATLKYFTEFADVCDEDDIVRFLLTASAIGQLFKKNASISAAEVGCQGEVGVACSMAAAALCERLGGTVEQVEDAAEIGMEHNLGLTCDPIAGLVQIPCIERNALGAQKAVSAARLALMGDGSGIVTLDEVMATMKQTGAEMSTKYKETSLGGLAVNVPVC